MIACCRVPQGAREDSTMSTKTYNRTLAAYVKSLEIYEETMTLIRQATFDLYCGPIKPDEDSTHAYPVDAPRFVS